MKHHSLDTDFTFYRRNAAKFNFSTKLIPRSKYSPSAPGALECFYSFVRSKKCPSTCSEPDILHSVLLSRASVLAYIRSEARSDRWVGVPVAFFLESFTEPPAWVLDMFVKEFIANH